MIHKTYNYQLSLYCTSLTQTKMKDYQSKFRGFRRGGGEGQDKETEKKKDVYNHVCLRKSHDVMLGQQCVSAVTLQF